jgi:hypothetical protein
MLPPIPAAAVLLMLLPAPAAQAQSIWTPRFDRGSVSVEVYKPSFDNDADLTFASSLWFVTARVPAASGVFFVGDLSYSHISYSYIGFKDDESSSTIGNPYVGVEFRRTGDDLSFELGTRLPLVDDKEPAASFYGLYGDLRRWEAWVEDILPVSLLAHYQKSDDRGFGVRIDAGPILWIATGDREDSELFVLLSIQGIYTGEDARASAGIVSRAILTNENYDGAESTFHEFGVSTAFRFGHVWPGFQFRIPLDEDLTDTIDYTFGLQMNFELN